LMNSHLATNPKQAETVARESLARLQSALNWLEDTTFEADAHDELHRAGADVQARFPAGCRLTWTGSAYEQRCPVAISHKRFGFSPGMLVGRRTCSLCGQDASECEHLRNRTYPVVGGLGPAGVCRICLKKDCAHTSADTAMVRPVTFLEEITLEEISLVSRPRQPDVRLLAVPIDGKKLRQALGSDFQYGVDTVQCSQCLQPCAGFDRLQGDPRES